MKWLICLVFLLKSVSVVAISAGARSDLPEDVSIVTLLADPDRYDGSTVQLVGFLRLEFEGNEIYLHEEDYRNGIYKNGFWVDLTPEIQKEAQELNMHYVCVVGTFSSKDKGHMSLMSGTLRIKNAVLWPPRSAKQQSQ